MARDIHIIHFIDPHCFYFKFDDDLHDFQLQEIEDEISTYARKKVKETEQFTPIEGEIVAAYQISWGKWVRAKVRSNLGDFKQFQLWAIDHGQLFQTAHKNVVPLPQELIDRKAKGVQQGSIYGISPASLVLHLDTYETELKPCENWSQKAINQCKQFINDKDILKIQYDIKEERNNYFFGNISIQALKTGAISIADFGKALVSINEAVQTEFQKDMCLITLKYDVPYAIDTAQSEISSRSSVVTGSTIRQVIKPNRCSVPSIAPSIAPSTLIPSEINDGFTRMNIGKRINYAAPSIVPSTVVPSEINNGITRMNIGNVRNIPVERIVQMNHRPNNKPHMPAGFEREITNFDKFNK